MAIAFLCCELLEELWSINNNGYNKEDYIEAKSNSRKAPQTIQRDVQIYNSFMNEHTESIIDRFKEAEIYFSALVMLIRIAMHMNSEEVNHDV